MCIIHTSNNKNNLILRQKLEVNKSFSVSWNGRRFSEQLSVLEMGLSPILNLHPRLFKIFWV